MIGCCRRSLPLSKRQTVVMLLPRCAVIKEYERAGNVKFPAPFFISYKAGHQVFVNRFFVIHHSSFPIHHFRREAERCQQKSWSIHKNCAIPPRTSTTAAPRSRALPLNCATPQPAWTPAAGPPARPRACWRAQLKRMRKATAWRANAPRWAIH